MRITDEIRRAFRETGRIGGLTAAANMTAEQRIARARHASHASRAARARRKAEQEDKTEAAE